jgi:putative nucleotidyltransferase with HDIG domain
VLYGGLFTLVRRASGDLQRTSGENARLYREARGLYTDLQQSNAELGLAYDTTLEGWSRTLELRDKETEGHTQRVTEMTVRLARALGFDAEALAHVRRGALLHDIGKMGIPDSVLLKPGALTPDEWAIMRLHPVYAYELLRPIAFLRPALDIPYCHHEKWDGSGYPRGLRGTEIPLAARIFAVVDVWDALRSERPYRAAWPEERVRAHIASLAGTHFEPRIVEAFLAAAPPLAAAPAPATAVSLAREPVALSA